LRSRFLPVLAKYECKFTDHFAGFQVTGKFDSNYLERLIQELPEGSTEFMCHPGFCTDELRSERTRLKESREAELRSLKAPSVRVALDRARVKLTNYRELGR
jgi:predicted glycoside hydrolase/deacetylase ChbG (UPF0249 family)